MGNKIKELDPMKAYKYVGLERHTRYLYEVAGMILLQDLQGITRLDLSKDMSVHVSAVWKM
jgi:hypothetical protein